MAQLHCHFYWVQIYSSCSEVNSISLDLQRLLNVKFCFQAEKKIVLKIYWEHDPNLLQQPLASVSPRNQGNYKNFKFVVLLKTGWFFRGRVRKHNVHQLGTGLVLKAWWICMPSSGTRSVPLLAWNWVIFISLSRTANLRAGKAFPLLPAVPSSAQAWHTLKWWKLPELQTRLSPGRAAEKPGRCSASFQQLVDYPYAIWLSLL